MQAVLRYNHSMDYVSTVLRWMQTYSTQTVTIPDTQGVITPPTDNTGNVDRSNDPTRTGTTTTPTPSPTPTAQPTTTRPTTGRPSIQARGRRRLRRDRRAAPGRAPRPLLSDARLGPRRRGRAPGGAASRLARAARVRGPSSLRSWLYRIATNACLKAIERRPSACSRSTSAPPPTRTTVPASRSWSRSGSSRTRTRPWVPSRVRGPGARYEQRESVELAFIAALQHLPPRQRAVLILRDVLGFSGAEVAASSRRPPRRSTARSSAPTRRSRSGFRSSASRPRSGRSATRRYGRSCAATWTPGSGPTSTRSSRC